MTPAIKLLQKRSIEHQVLTYEHDPDARAYGLEAAEKLGLDPAHVFKTLIVELDSGPLAMGIVPVAQTLNMKAMARACAARKAQLAERKDAERATGYVMGGISPLGQKKRLPCVLDKSATDLQTVYVSGGRRGLDLALAPGALIELLEAKLESIARSE
ncbi:MAG: Cys-tRNA(Pro) deacylase [Gammaproteobacteria bacterium]